MVAGPLIFHFSLKESKTEQLVHDTVSSKTRENPMAKKAKKPVASRKAGAKRKQVSIKGAAKKKVVKAKTAKPKKRSIAKTARAAVKTSKPKQKTVARRRAASSKGTAPKAKVELHPGMMGDGTEEQNLNQPGNPEARIAKAEIDTAFKKPE
jgi:hypothetical protein